MPNKCVCKLIQKIGPEKYDPLGVDPDANFKKKDSPYHKDSYFFNPADYPTNPSGFDEGFGPFNFSRPWAIPPVDPLGSPWYGL
jgi:hypothetical protein